MVSFTEINLQFKVQCYKTSTKAESYRFWSVSEPQSHSKFIVCPLLFCCIALIQPTWCLLFSESFDWMNRFLSTILHTHKLPAHCFCFVLVCLFVLPESWILNLNYLPCFFWGGFFVFKLTTTPDCSNCNIWHTWLFHTEDVFESSGTNLYLQHSLLYAYWQVWPFPISSRWCLGDCMLWLRSMFSFFLFKWADCRYT